MGIQILSLFPTYPNLLAHNNWTIQTVLQAKQPFSSKSSYRWIRDSDLQTWKEFRKQCHGKFGGNTSTARGIAKMGVSTMIQPYVKAAVEVRSSKKAKKSTIDKRTKYITSSIASAITHPLLLTQIHQGVSGYLYENETMYASLKATMKRRQPYSGVTLAVSVDLANMYIYDLIHPFVNNYIQTFTKQDLSVSSATEIRERFENKNVRKADIVATLLRRSFLRSISATFTQVATNVVLYPFQTVLSRFLAQKANAFIKCVTIALWIASKRFMKKKEQRDSTMASKCSLSAREWTSPSTVLCTSLLSFCPKLSPRRRAIRRQSRRRAFRKMKMKMMMKMRMRMKERVEMGRRII